MQRHLLLEGPNDTVTVSNSQSHNLLTNVKKEQSEIVTGISLYIFIVLFRECYFQLSFWILKLSCNSCRFSKVFGFLANLNMMTAYIFYCLIVCVITYVAFIRNFLFYITLLNPSCCIACYALYLHVVKSVSVKPYSIMECSH